MKYVTFEINGSEKVGILGGDGSWVIPVSALDMPYASMNELIDGITEEEKQKLQDAAGKDFTDIPGAISCNEVKLLAPIPQPRQDIICLGINYMAHAYESARFKNESFNGERPYPVYFSKRVNRAVADGEPIPAHQDIVDSLDYEAELAIVIGKEARNVPAEQALDYLFGYTIINDVSARNIQSRHKQWYFGKGLDGFTPMGPHIVSADEIAFPPKLSIQSRINGELRQNSNTELLIFDIPYIIHDLSQGMTLKPGTIISTGTPDGVGLGFEPPKFLKPGDVVECCIEEIGILTNTIQ